MLKLFYRIDQLSFSKLMDVYSDSNEKKAAEDNTTILEVEQDFYQYLQEEFYSIEGSFYAVWEEGKNYLSALRIEPFKDGFLVEALESLPAKRCKGYASKLLSAVLNMLQSKTIYSHVNKLNTASLRVHQKCGFVQLYNHASFIDGSYSKDYVTLCYTPKNS